MEIWKLHDTYTCTMLKNEKEHDRPSVLKYRKKKGNIKLYAIYMVLKILRISNPISNCKSVALSMLT